MAVNLVHGNIRRRLVRPEQETRLRETMGEEGSDRFLASGITGVNPSKVWTNLLRTVLHPTAVTERSCPSPPAVPLCACGMYLSSA